jgi:hypothetical protein
MRIGWRVSENSAGRFLESARRGDIRAVGPGPAGTAAAEHLTKQVKSALVPPPRAG